MYYVFLVAGSLKCGAKVEGTVLFVDFQNGCVELTLHQAVMKRINSIQGTFTLSVMMMISSHIQQGWFYYGKFSSIAVLQALFLYLGSIFPCPLLSFFPHLVSLLGYLEMGHDFFLPWPFCSSFTIIFLFYAAEK